MNPGIRFGLPLLLASLLLSPTGLAKTFHVAKTGDDAAPGSRSRPLRTIQRAADLAQPGDVITVHAGTYRERVNPPRGGTSDRRRITYQAARGEAVEIKGSELICSWTRVERDVWKAEIPSAFFGAFNPYADLIHGDWFEPRGREHHTGAVYLNGEWLTEAVKLDELFLPAGTSPDWITGGGGQYLLNVAWFRPAGAPDAARIPATRLSARQGTQNAACSEGGDCLGFIEQGHWVRYDAVDFGSGTEQLELRTASAADGGTIEIHLDQPTGELLGTAQVAHTGDWQSWVSVPARIRRTSGTHPVALVFKARASTGVAPRPVDPRLWYARVNDTTTTIWAQFPGVNPNEQLTEINVRQSVFYPDQPGRNFITVRGFTLRHAATPWAPPTAQQIGLIGTHWSKGWIIEDNVVSHSVCSGISLGKHGDEFDNTSANTAEGYVKTIERGHARGWNRETIGHHVVRHNTVSHCEQAGIVGSLGPAFCEVTDNTIHNIHVRRLFTGAEMAGIKFHGAIDTVIRNNHIHHTCLGLWLDWMAQGTRVSGNFFHDNAGQDLFVEVDHGPFLVDNNLFLSPTSLLDVSEGGAYAHNLFLGKIVAHPEMGRETPYHPAHSTTVAGLAKVPGGDDRFHNNLFFGPGAAGVNTSKDPEWRGGHGLWVYNFRAAPLSVGGNVYYRGAQPYAGEAAAVADAGTDPQVVLRNEGGWWTLELTPGTALKQARTAPVTTGTLGNARVPNLPYENADGSPVRVDRDFLGRKRSGSTPSPGPFEGLGAARRSVRLR